MRKQWIGFVGLPELCIFRRARNDSLAPRNLIRLLPPNPKGPARSPARAQLASFNFPSPLIWGPQSSALFAPPEIEYPIHVAWQLIVQRNEIEQAFPPAR
jgi:hypothetical protein